MDRIAHMRTALDRIVRFGDKDSRTEALDALLWDDGAAIAQDAAQMEDREYEQNRLWAEMDAELRIDPATERR